MARPSRGSVDRAPRRHPGLKFGILESVGAMIDASHELQFRSGESADGCADHVGTRLFRAEKLPQLVERRRTVQILHAARREQQHPAIGAA